MADATKWHVLAERGAREARERGFQLTTWENLPAKLMFIIDEIDEARDEWLGSTCAETLDARFGEELADITIRMLESLHSLWGSEWDASRLVSAEQAPMPPRLACTRALEAQLWNILAYVCRALRAWTRDDRKDAMICLELAVVTTMRVAKRFGRDLEADILKKLDSNKGRPFLHGKTKNLG